MKSQEVQFHEALHMLVAGLEKENVSAVDAASITGALALIEIARQLCRITDAQEKKKWRGEP